MFPVSNNAWMTHSLLRIVTFLLVSRCRPFLSALVSISTTSTYSNSACKFLFGNYQSRCWTGQWLSRADVSCYCGLDLAISESKLSYFSRHPRAWSKETSSTGPYLAQSSTSAPKFSCWRRILSWLHVNISTAKMFLSLSCCFDY